MKGIIAYLLVLLATIIGVACIILQGLLPPWLATLQIPISCALVGAVGGITYCLRGVYLNACVRPDYLLPAYHQGRNLAESYYLSLVYLSWQSVIVGDPLCALKP